MSKIQEKIALYTSEVEKLGLGIDVELLAAVTKELGPSIYKDDAEKVSSSDKKELETVKSNFLIKKLGLKESEQLDAAIEATIEKIGSSNRNKYRAIFYTILVEELGMQALYTDDKVEEIAVVAKVKEEAPVVAKVKEEAPVVAKVKEEAPVAAVVKEEAPVVAKVKEEAPVVAVVKEEAPVVAKVKEEAPVAAVVKEEAPVVAKVKEEAPVAAVVKEEAPVVAVVKKETPVTEKVKEEAPVVAVVKKETPVIAEVKEEAPAVAKVKEETAVLEEVKEVQEKVSPEEFLANFNWHKYEEGIEAIDEENIKAFEAALEGTLGLVSEREVIDGTVIRKTDREAIIDINSKSEGVISLNEFRYNPNLAVGDIVEVLVDKREDSTGQLVLSHKKARVIKAWDRVNNAHETGEVVNGFVKCRTRGGMIVDVFGIEAFLPGSQIDVKPIRDYDQYVEKTMEFKVVKINHEFKNVVVSHKALIEADIEIQKKEIIGKLEKGQVLEGVVKNITSYGVFVDLGGVDGLIHITDLSWSRINHPSEVVELDQTLNVVILDFDDEKTRIQLGLKQLNAHPWEALDETIKVGDSVKGKVVVLADYGAFLEVAQGVEGLIHVSEMSWSTHLRSAQDFVSVGDVVKAQVLTLDREERKMSLGIKQLHPDPWNNIAEKFPVGSSHTGIVRNYTNFGVFVELEEGIDGLVYISDLSWTKKIKHPSDFVSVGDKMEVQVLELDIEGRKLNLGHKQTTKNPWDIHEATYTINSIHKGIVKEKSDKGLIVTFDDGVDAFVPGRFTTKEDGTKLSKGDSDKFKIIEFNKEFRRMVASHTSIFKAQEEKNIKTAQKKAELVEKTTLGDLGGDLAALKKKMEGK